MSGPTDNLSDELRIAATQAAIADRVRQILGTDARTAKRVTDAFDRFVAQPLAANLAKLRGHDLALRNPMIYTARGIHRADDWIDRVLEDKETSAVEGHLGTWLEEVAQIVSGGVKPGSGVDLQLTRDDGSITLYAIQSAPSTKNAGSRKSDVQALKKAAKPLRAHRKVVDLRIAVLWGRKATAEYGGEPGVEIEGSDDFWNNITGIEGFRGRLLEATVVMAELIGSRSTDEVERIRNEARNVFARQDGDLDVTALANPPRPARRSQTR